MTNKNSLTVAWHSPEHFDKLALEYLSDGARITNAKEGGLFAAYKRLVRSGLATKVKLHGADWGIRLKASASTEA
jgi:hypothetical protein